MLYRFLFGYTRNNFYQLVKYELICCWRLIKTSLLLFLLTFVIYARVVKFCSFLSLILLTVIAFNLIKIFIYLLDMLSLNIKYIECHYAEIKWNEGYKSRYPFYSVKYLKSDNNYYEAKFRSSFAIKRINDVIINGPNIILFYSKYSNLLLGFYYNDKIVKFCDVDFGVSNEVYQSMLESD